MFKPGLVFGALWLVACRPVQEPRIDEAAGSVALTITAAEPMAGSEAGAKSWVATCGAEKFLIELTIPPVDPSEPISFTMGKLCRFQGTDAPKCLDTIARALEARQIEPSVERLDCLPFQAAILGQDLSRGAGDSVHAGSFTSDSPGTWLATKAFVADGEGELYLNLSPETSEAEISIKDPEYGDVVVRELAKVMAGHG